MDRILDAINRVLNYDANLRILNVPIDGAYTPTIDARDYEGLDFHILGQLLWK